jgi:uncharacterized OB-fold protein
MPADSFPAPDLNFEPLRPFWAAAARKKLELPRCGQCAAFNWYPAEICAQCHAMHFNWVELAPVGTVFSWSVVERPLYEPYAIITPYVPVMVQLRDAPTVRLVTRLIDTDFNQLRMGLPVDLVFKDLAYPTAATGVIAPLARLAINRA